MSSGVDYVNICRLLGLHLNTFSRYSRKVDRIITARPLDLRSFESMIGYVRYAGVVSASETLKVEDAYLKMMRDTDITPRYALALVLNKFKKIVSCRDVCHKLNVSYRRVRKMSIKMEQ